jgi:hypothetical protein
MAAHLLDHFIFSSRRLRHRTKAIVFGVTAFAIVGTFWWFRNVAFGMDGPIADHWGLRWRKVSRYVPVTISMLTLLHRRRGISMKSRRVSERSPYLPAQFPQSPHLTFRPIITIDYPLRTEPYLLPHDILFTGDAKANDFD